MTETDTVQAPSRRRFPWLRLAYAIGFAVIAWVVLWISLCVLAPLYFVTLAITGRESAELKDISARVVRYVYEVALFVTGARDETPFPLGPLPKP